MDQMLRNIWQGLTTATPLDQVNFVLGVVGVWLMIRRTLWAFPVGLIAVAVQGGLFFQTRFYADAALQVFFFATLAWGWWHWVQARGAAPELPVTTLSWRSRAVTLALAVGATVGWALVLERWTDAIMPWRDAFIAAFQVAAQVLQARKKLENWSLWIVANTVAVASYWRADMAYTAFLFGIYLVMAVAGHAAWQRTLRRGSAA